MKGKGKFMLIDGNSLANRAFYAIPMLSNSQGFITNAIYGFYNMLQKVMEMEKPDYVAVAFDQGRIVFRHQEFGEYKAKRKAMPDELRPQFPVLKKLLGAMNVAVLECEDYEADDIIGALVKLGEKEGLSNVIITGDRDALQLISPDTRVELTRRGITEMDSYDEKALLEKYGLSPWQVVELKGLMGDASDNIPGIPGVGEKTALKLIHEYKDVENVLAHSGDFKGKKLGQLLEQYADQARLSRHLAVIETCVPLDFDLKLYRVREPDYPRLVEMLTELEFKNILQRVLEQTAAPSQAGLQEFTPDLNGMIVDEPAVLEAYLASSGAEVSLYLETENAGGAVARITGLGLKAGGGTPGENRAVWLVWQDSTGLDDFLKILKPYLERAAVQKTVHDAKNALLACASYGISLRGVRYDTLLMAYLLDSSRAKTGLEDLALDYLGFCILAEKGLARNSALLAVLEKLGPQLQRELADQELWGLYEDVELPLTVILAKMERSGVLLDEAVLDEIGEELDGRIAKLTAGIYELAGEEFNINSPRQLGVILFEKLGLARGKKTKTGYSTSASVLEALAGEHEIVAWILHYRQLVKIKSTYIDGLKNLVDESTKRVHTSFNQTVTATGRLSSTEPNLQNIPIRMEEGRRLRKAFIPSPERLFLCADYSQIELRVLAHIAGDEVLTEAFHKDQDIHARTAAEVFGVKMDHVTTEMRRAAKAVNFGIVYGISDFGLSQDLGISRYEAKEYIDSYFKRYYGVKLYIDRVIEEAREKGYVTTILKRRRYLPDILSRNFHLRAFAERAAMNTPIQGSAADIIKLAMIRLQAEIDKQGYGGPMILQVHDELIFETPVSEIGRMGQLVREVMSTAYPLAVPLKVDLQTGPNWYELEPLLL